MALRHVFFPTWHRPAPHRDDLPAGTQLAGLRAVPEVRVWLVRLGRISLTLGLLACAGDVGRRGVAEWYYNLQTLDGLRRAVRWCPENARYLAALADALENSALEGDAVEAVLLSEKAALLAPLDARGWARLGAAYEAAGRTADAARAYQKAVVLFPRSPEMNWRLGNFLLRKDDTGGALAAFRKVVMASPAMRRAAFQTAWGATDDSRQILDRMIPQQPGVFSDYLRYLVDTDRLDAAREVWWRIFDGGFPMGQAEAFRYLDALLAAQRSEDAIAAWDALATRAPGLYASARRAGNRVTNGGFEFDVLNGGLDWRFVPVEGAAARVIPGRTVDGDRCLEVAFAGTHNVDFWHVFEFVPVESATRYLFSARVRARELSSDSGPRFLLRDAGDERRLHAETSAILGTAEWAELRLEFRTTSATRLLDLRLVRPASKKFDGKIGGTLWVDDVRVEALGPATNGAHR